MASRPPAARPPAALPPAPRGPVSFPAPSTAPRGARGLHACLDEEIGDAAVLRPPAALPPVGPPPAPRSTSGTPMVQSAARCAAAPEEGQQEKVEIAVDWPMCRQKGGGELCFKKGFLAKHGFSSVWLCQDPFLSPWAPNLVWRFLILVFAIFPPLDPLSSRQ